MKKVYILDKDRKLSNSLKEIMKKEKNIEVKRYNHEDLEDVLISIPDIFIINEDSLNADIKKIFKIIKRQKNATVKSRIGKYGWIFSHTIRNFSGTLFCVCFFCLIFCIPKISRKRRSNPQADH